METPRALYLALARLYVGRSSDTPGLGASRDRTLTPFELRVLSQNGEDGVLCEILSRIGAGERFFVEFGVETGREGNCVYLADVAHWRGLFLDGDAQAFGVLERKYRANERVTTAEAMVTPENVEVLFAAAGVPAEPSVVSIDVDGADYWIWDAIRQYRPRVVVIEYNSVLDPTRRLVQPRDLSRGWDGSDYFGASIGALRALGAQKGYRLVHTELCGVNAFFVRDDLAGENFPGDDDVPIRAAPNYFQAGRGHPPHSDSATYLDLDSNALVSAPSPIGTPAAPLQEDFSLWRERALSAEEHLARSYAQTADATAAYEHAAKDLDAIKGELASQTEHLAAARRLLAEREESLRVVAEQLEAAGSRLAAYEQQLSASRAALKELEASASWRLTRPLRAVGRRLRGSRTSGSS